MEVDEVDEVGMGRSKGTISADTPWKRGENLGRMGPQGQAI